MVSVKSYRIQLSSASCNYKSKMNFQKTALFVFSLYLVHAMIGGRGFRGFVLIAIGKMAILTIFLQLQDNIKLIRRCEGCYYTRLESYYIIFYFETDWSRIRQLPSTTLTNSIFVLIEKLFKNAKLLLSYILNYIHCKVPNLLLEKNECNNYDD